MCPKKIIKGQGFSEILTKSNSEDIQDGEKENMLPFPLNFRMMNGNSTSYITCVTYLPLLTWLITKEELSD